MKSASRLSQGFPAKVVRSIDAVHLALDRFGPPIYILRRIINDENVVESLADIGAMTVEALDEIPDEGIVVLPVRASPQEYEKAASKNLQVIDDVHTLEESGHQDRHSLGSPSAAEDSISCRYLPTVTISSLTADTTYITSFMRALWNICR